MEPAIVMWAVTILTGKAFAGIIRNPVTVDVLYLLWLAVCVATVNVVGIEAALPLTILLCAGSLFTADILVSANHSILELFILVLFLRLLDQPVVLASAIQLVTASVWLYAVVQKLYHGNYLDGWFLYVTFQKSSRWARFHSKVPRLEGYYGLADARGRAYCRRMSLAVLATEAIPPLVALVASGTVWSVLLLVMVSFAVGVVSKETNFLITNLMAAAFFLIPFDASGLATIADDPIAAGVLVWLLVWPPAHAVLTRRLRFSSWKLAGWGMYATHEPAVEIVRPDGELLAAPTTPATPYRILQVCGACEIRWLREYAHRRYFRVCHKEPASALVFRWYRRRGDRYITSGVVIPNTPGAEATAFEICGEGGVAEFRRRIAAQS